MRLDIEVRDGELVYDGGPPHDAFTMTAVSATATEFGVTRLAPAAPPVYYRFGGGRLRVSDDLGAMQVPGRASEPDHGMLLAAVHGLPDAPGSTPLPGVQELTVGSRLRMDPGAMSVSSEPLPAAPAQPLHHAVATALSGGDAETGEVAIAYSGGLASSFLAVSARDTGRRVRLFHADLGGGAQPPQIEGARLHRVDFDLFDLLDPGQITGRELTAPSPDLVFRQRLLAGLQAVAGTPLASGALLEALVATRLPAVLGPRRVDRLLTCEPFHRGNVLTTVKQAREALAGNGHGTPSGERPVKVAVPAGDTIGDGVPGLTEAGRTALKTARLATAATWRTHLDELSPVVGRAEAGRREAGLAGPVPGVSASALDPQVLAAIAAIPADRLGRVHAGRFVNHAPLRDRVKRAGAGPVDEASSGFRVRHAAATYLYRRRLALAAELSGDCALADLGLIDPAPVVRLLRDGPATADRALPLLRFIWLDRWLRRR